MNMIEKLMISIREWVEFYLYNSTVSEKTKDKVRSLLDSICKVK